MLKLFFRVRVWLAGVIYPGDRLPIGNCAGESSETFKESVNRAAQAAPNGLYDSAVCARVPDGCPDHSCPPFIMGRQAFDVLHRYEKKNGFHESRNISSGIERLIERVQDQNNALDDMTKAIPERLAAVEKIAGKHPFYMSDSDIAKMMGRAAVDDDPFGDKE
jgi:hypothetical protein